MRNGRPQKGAGGRKSSGSGSILNTLARAAVGAGGVAGGVEELAADQVPMEGDVDAKMMSSDPARQPLTTLSAKKPGFWENFATRGQAGMDYRDLDARLKMQEMQQRFAAGQQTAQDVAALQRITEAARLENEAKIAAEQRARGYAGEDRTRKTGAMNNALNEVNLARMRQGLPPIDRVSDFEGAQIAFGEGNIAQRGVVPALTTLIPEGREAMIRGNQAQSILDYQSQRPDQAGLAWGAELQSTIDKPALAQRGMGLGERTQTEAERSNLSREQLAGKTLEFERSRPIVGGGGLFFNPADSPYSPYAFLEGQKAETTIMTDEQGNRVFGTRPATAPSIKPLSTGKKPVGSIDPSLLNGVTANGGNPAPQNATPPNLGLLSGQQTLSTPLSFNTQQTPTGFTATPRQAVTPQQVEEAKRRLQQLLSQPLR